MRILSGMATQNRTADVGDGFCVCGGVGQKYRSTRLLRYELLDPFKLFRRIRWRNYPVRSTNACHEWTAFGIWICWTGRCTRAEAVQSIGSEWRVDWLGFHFGAAKNTAGTIRLIEFWIIPFWSIVIPMTLLSAWLLLSKPRKSTSEKITESVPEKVG